MEPFPKFAPAFIILSQSFFLVTSQTTPSAIPPFDLIFNTVSSSGFLSRSQSRSFAPSLANQKATACPIPRPAPVITAVLFFNRSDISIHYITP